MKQFRQGRGWIVLTSALALWISSAAGQDATNSVKSPVIVPPAIIPPPMPMMVSPVEYFRKLLAMSPEQLQKTLANKPLQIRERILAKVNEYAAMDPDDREVRLRATELRWYMAPLLEAPPAQLKSRLDNVPSDIRNLVRSRIMQWELLPPALQQEFLENESIAGYFADVNSTNRDSTEPALSNADQSRWNKYTAMQRQGMIAEFNGFFNLSASEKQAALGALTDIERKEMEQTLQAFGKMPMRQRVECIRAFGKFSSMTSEERAEFLKNAQRWSKMTPSERQAWRDLVAHVPQWPPLPPAIMPPMPHPVIVHPAQHPAPENINVAATNQG